MKTLYYPLWYRLDGLNRYLIWISREEVNEDLDGVYLDSSGKIPVFGSLNAMLDYAQNQDIAFADGALILHNLDVIKRWLKVKRSKAQGPTSIDCDAFLCAWNFFVDVSRSLGGGFDADRDRTRKIYSKIFYGNNLPAITPAGKHYIPLWSNREKRIIREIMAQGLTMLRNNIKYTR